MSISSDISKKEKSISNLEKYKKDLSDDSGDIRSINKMVGIVQSRFQSFIVSDNTAQTVDKLGSFVEPYQSDDGNLNSSVSYINSEITALRREIEALERARDAANAAKAAIKGR